MGGEIRRVVTCNEADGKAVVLFDGASPRITARPEAGVKSSLLWVTDTTPVEAGSSGDCADRHSATPGGQRVFRIVDFYPVDDGNLPTDHMTQHMGADASRKGWAPRHPAMHRTRSVDYAIVMSGEIDMLLDDSEIHLKAGDVLVQQSTNHARQPWTGLKLHQVRSC